MTNNTSTRPKPASGSHSLPWSTLLLVSLACGFAAGAVLAQEAATSASTKDAALIGSVPFGKSIFRGYCQSCHGATAQGDGPVGVHLKVPPANLTEISQRNDGAFPADKVAKAIESGRGIKGHGSHEMPIWGEAFEVVEGGQSQEQVGQRVADLVAYLESIQK